MTAVPHILAKGLSDKALDGLLLPSRDRDPRALLEESTVERKTYCRLLV